MLNIYHVSCGEDLGYDSYSEFVCIAETEDDARMTHPTGGIVYSKEKCGWSSNYGEWTNNIQGLIIEKLGEAKNGESPRVVVASYHAG
jgi:hypothetical protein